MSRLVVAPSSTFLTALAVLLSLLHAVLAVTATVDKSMTSDEIAHFTAGQAYNLRGDYRLQPENGNLPQRLAALPMTLASQPLPSPDLESWKTADVWNYGHQYFYGRPLAVEKWMFLGRALIALVSAATGMLIFFWSRALFGLKGAFLSLTFFVFCPAFLAHGALATSDVVMTFFFVASVSAWWMHLNRPGTRWMIISAVTVGFAFVAKFSAVLLPLMLALIGVVWASAAWRREGWRKTVIRLAVSTSVHLVAAGVIIWLFYGFRYSAFAPEFSEGATFNHGWGVMLGGLGLPANVLWWLKEHKVLPEAWLYGLSFVLQFSRARGAFMSGEYSVTGWVTFFPWAFLIKSTLPLLIIAAGALITCARSSVHRNQSFSFSGSRLFTLTPLLVLFGVYWITSLASNLNIGHRHILPTYPVIFVFIGCLGVFLTRRRLVGLLAILSLAGWHIVEAAKIRPHYLAYFNQIIGGPQNGWRHLVDSSLDWGQDLPGLKKWLDANNRRGKVFLSYFGTGNPKYEGITATWMPMLPEVGAARPWHRLEPGIYAVSATMLQHVYSKIRGPWTAELEAEFQQLRAIEDILMNYQSSAAERERRHQQAPAENWSLAWKRYEQLRFARLAHYLRVKDPEAAIGHAMFVFRLNAAELDAATGPSIHAWRALIERAVEARGRL